MNTDKVFDIIFSYTETAKGIVLADSVESVKEGLAKKYGTWPNFKIESVTELELPEGVLEALSDTTSTETKE